MKNHSSLSRFSQCACLHINFKMNGIDLMIFIGGMIIFATRRQIQLWVKFKSRRLAGFHMSTETIEQLPFFQDLDAHHQDLLRPIFIPCNYPAGTWFERLVDLPQIELRGCKNSSIADP